MALLNAIIQLIGAGIAGLIAGSALGTAAAIAMTGDFFMTWLARKV